MTIGFPTIIIPAVQGGNGGEPSDEEFRLTKDEISWLSKLILKARIFDLTDLADRADLLDKMTKFSNLYSILSL